MPSTHRLRDAATGLVATAGLLVIVVGVPAALVRFVGWPLPTAVPDVAAIGAALRYGHVAPDTLLKALAVVIWIAWLLMTAGIALEMLALVRGTVARTLPTIAGVQRLCGRLLTAAMLLSTLATRPAAATEPARSPEAAVAPTVEPAPRASVDERADADPAWVVRRHDSLWTIAERALGGGHRWREIRDLNVGRPQPGGGRLRPDDTMIQPGWVLRLPADARERPTEVKVERGDHLWGLAEAHLGDGTRWRELYAHNRGVPQPDGERLSRPDLIQPGWVLTLPAPRATASDDRDRPPVPRDGTTRPQDDGRVRRGTRVPPLPLTPRTLPDAHERTSRAAIPVPHGGTEPAAVSSSGPRDPVMVASTHRSDSERPALPVAGGALLAAGLVALLARRRRQWLRRRRPGSALGPVDPEAAELERWLRAMADHDLSQRTDRVLRLLREHFDEHGVHVEVLALEVGERIRLLLSAAGTSPPPGITASDDGRTWLVDGELEVAAPMEDDGPPLIATLVTCGRRRTGEIVALNLLAAGVLDVEDARPQVEEVLTSWTAELAARGAAAGVELIVVGPHHHLVEQFARVTIAEDARAAAARVDHVLVPDGTQQGTPPSRVVVLSSAPVTDEAWTALRRRGGEDPRLAVVTARGTGTDGSAVDPATCRMTLDGDRVLVDPPGIELAAPEWLTPDTWERFGDLLCQPVRERHSDVVPSPLLTAPLDRNLGDPEASDDERGTPDRMVRVLGPLRIDGLPAPGPPARDVLALLAAHRTGVALEDVLARVAHPAEQVRAAVAELSRPEGQAMLTVDDSGCRLADGVGSDVGQFRALTRRLDHLAPADQAGAMEAALALVHGPPFGDCGDWVSAYALTTTTAALISDVAHRMATLVLTFGELERAGWAVDRGLLANPGCELLYRDRMRIADAAGDHAALDAIMLELRTRAAEDDGWVTPETLQLFERLKRSTTITAAPFDDLDGRRHAS